MVLRGEILLSDVMKTDEWYNKMYPDQGVREALNRGKNR